MGHGLMLLAALCLRLPQSGQAATVAQGDILSVQVISFPEFSGQFPVVSDGSLSGPGFGRISAKGRTLAAINKDITARLSKRLNSPDVFVSFYKQSTRFVYLLGAKVTPSVPSAEDKTSQFTGQIELKPGMDLRSLLAGSTFGEDSDRYTISLFRGGASVARLAVSDLLQGAKAPELQSNDVVIVQPLNTVKVWLLDGFKSVGEKRVPEGATLDQAISIAGGADLGQNATDNLQADLYKVVLRRGGQRQVFSLRTSRDEMAKIILEPGDSISLERPAIFNVTVSGYVAKEGEYKVSDSTDVFTAIAKAGGATANGTLSGVLVFRGREVRRFDLSKIRQGELPPPYKLERDDLVVVPENLRTVYVFGEVARPGKVPIPDDKTYRLSDVFAISGGLSGKGTLRRVSLMRPAADGKYMMHSYNLDEFLKDGDRKGDPVIEPGDVIVFGEPKGLTLQGVSAFVSSLLFINTLRR